MVFWLIVLLLLFGWGGGFALSFGGNFIHLLLVIALIMAIYELFYASPRRLP